MLQQYELSFVSDAAKMCPNFTGPDNRAQFKLEIMEVFRTAKQRQYLKHADKRNRSRGFPNSENDDVDDPNSDDPNSDDPDNADLEVDNPVTSDESD